MTRNSEARVRPARADVRAGVLAAARELFNEVGYHRASLDMIAKRAGYSKGAVYSNFASKDDLFLALLTAELQDRSERLVELAHSSDGVDADIAKIAAGIVNLVVEQPEPNVVFAEFRAFAAREEALSARLGVIRDLLVRGIADRLETEVNRRGLKLTIPAIDAATLVVALINGLALEQIGRTTPVVSPSSMAVVIASLVRA
jgi:AcrR family transcriptional regulator